MKTVIKLALVLLSVMGAAFSQQWAGILDPTRATDWSTAGIPGGVPVYGTLCGTIIAAYTGSATAITNAIAACPNGTYVQLGAGTFHLSSTIQFGTHGVVLRGSGPNSTIIKWSGGSVVCGVGQVCGIAIGPIGVYDNGTQVQPGQSNALAITGTDAGCAGGGVNLYPQNCNKITVGTVGSHTPVVGTLLIMDQVNDQAVVAGVIQGDNPTVTSGKSLSGNDGAFGRQPSGGDGSIKRSQMQVAIITNIAGSTYTISPAIYFNNVRSSQSPGAWWNDTNVVGAGVENMTVDGSGPAFGQTITFINAYHSWIKNVRFVCTTALCPRSHVAFGQSLAGVIRDSYLFGAEAGGGAEGYGIEGIESSGFLIENNIFDQNIAPLIGSGSTGQVTDYNFSWNNITAGSTFMQGTYTSHDAGNAMHLFEGNDFNALLADNQHGGSPLTTMFRNILHGNQPVPFNKTSQQTVAINQDSYNRVINAVGNVLGMITAVGGPFAGKPCDKNSQVSPGTCSGTPYHTNYEASPAVGTTGCNTSIYNLGFGTGDGCLNPGPPTVAAGNDNEVATSLLRWGNCDVVTATCRNVSGEIPTSGGTFYGGNAVPASTALPASFYYSSTPPWWGNLFNHTVPFPPIGPDVSGGDIALPAGIAGKAYSNLARLCYENTALDVVNYPATAIIAYDYANCTPTPAAQLVLYPNGAVHPLRQLNIFSGPLNSADTDWSHFTTILGNSANHAYFTGHSPTINMGCVGACGGAAATYLDHVGTGIGGGGCPSVTFTGASSVDSLFNTVAGFGFFNNMIISGAGFVNNSVTSQYVGSVNWANNLDGDCANPDQSLTWLANTSYEPSHYILAQDGNYWQMQKMTCSNSDTNDITCASGSSLPNFGVVPCTTTCTDNQAVWTLIGANAPPQDYWCDVNTTGANQFDCYKIKFDGTTNANITGGVAFVPVQAPPSYPIGLTGVTISGASNTNYNCPPAGFPNATATITAATSTSVSYTCSQALPTTGSAGVTGTIFGAHALNINSFAWLTVAILGHQLPIPWEQPIMTWRKTIYALIGAHYSTPGNPRLGYVRMGLVKAGESDTSSNANWPCGTFGSACGGNAKKMMLTYEKLMFQFQSQNGAGTAFACVGNLHTYPTEEAAYMNQYNCGFDNNALGTKQVAVLYQNPAQCLVAGSLPNGGDWCKAFANYPAQPNGQGPVNTLQTGGKQTTSSPGSCDITDGPTGDVGSLAFDGPCTTTPFTTGYPGNLPIAQQYLGNNQETYFCDVQLALDPNYNTSACTPPPSCGNLAACQTAYGNIYKSAFSSYLNPQTIWGSNQTATSQFTVTFGP